jgi:transcriptional regulator with XRE-family HTH domain
MSSQNSYLYEMASTKWIDDRFGDRLKAERERRGWTQPELAMMLSDKGIEPMHATTIAKIEAARRSVRINEAVGIADLFGVSLDSLLGLKWRPKGDDIDYALRVLHDAARQSAYHARLAADGLDKQLRELDNVPSDLDADDELRPLLGEAEVAAIELQRMHEKVEGIAQMMGDLSEKRQGKRRAGKG